MSGGVWTLDGREAATLGWERVQMPGPAMWCAYGSPMPDGFRPIYWITQHAARRFHLAIIDSRAGMEHPKEVEERPFGTLGLAQMEAEAHEGGRQ